ncbi:amino acid ABC transporter permease [Pseudodesulfovibrio sp. zrk46]|uniref:amino acid ABC transporter permease n=1 Tax=Pseudodesulfovibrio sp. zrk46 TaxID=2725288 RepID=UPI00144A1FC7|nr:amino acid ABC transporter permease [Pseudodesulfovibrio sp. zrk46]QJB57233.1 ABC transporter permease subunit [Pseudodesulfovibrio sp. zrk46]
MSKKNALLRSAVFAALLVLFLFVSGAQAVASDAVDADALMRQANNVMVTGDLEGAVKIYLQIPAPGPEGDEGQFASSRMQAARLEFAVKDYPAALSIVDELLAVYPENIEAKQFRDSVEEAMMPQWKRLMQDTIKFVPHLLKGSLMTLLLVVFTMIISPIGGLFVALGRISNFKPVSRLCWFIIWLFRGTPLLLQLFFIYYGLPAIGITLKPIPAALIGLGLNYSAYLAEIIRSGILSIDHGQMEAAEAMGMSYWQAMRRVIIPQTYRVILPPVGNEFIALIKDTALVSTIAMVELMRTADQLFNASFNITVLGLAAVIYLMFTTVFTFAFERLEDKVGAYEKR